MSLYAHERYKALLRTAILRKKARDPRTTHEKLAEACKIQKTYLSKVLNRDGHLSADQLFRAARFLGLDEEERGFLFALYELERTEIDERRAELAKVVARFRRRHSKTERHLAGANVTRGAADSDLRAYYLNPDAQLVHLFLTIEAYRREPPSIAKRLGFAPAYLARLVALLERSGLIEREKGGGVRAIDRDLHLSKSSDLYEPYRKLVRLKSLERLQREDDGRDYSFSVFFSADPKTRDAIQERFFEFLKAAQKLAKEARATEVYQMGFDLLRWS